MLLSYDRFDRVKSSSSKSDVTTHHRFRSTTWASMTSAVTFVFHWSMRLMIVPEFFKHSMAISAPNYFRISCLVDSRPAAPISIMAKKFGTTSAQMTYSYETDTINPYLSNRSTGVCPLTLNNVENLSFRKTNYVHTFQWIFFSVYYYSVAKSAHWTVPTGYQNSPKQLNFGHPFK